MQTVHVPRPSRVEELLVVLKIEAVEVNALAAFDLLDAQDHAAPQLERLAGAGLEPEPRMGSPLIHRAPPYALPSGRAALWRAKNSRSAMRTTPSRSATPTRAIVASINSSCC